MLRYKEMCIFLLLCVLPATAVADDLPQFYSVVFFKPYGPIGPTSTDQCSAFSNEISEYKSKVSESHNKCLKAHTADRDLGACYEANCCTRSACQSLHNRRNEKFTDEVRQCYAKVQQYNKDSESYNSSLKKVDNELSISSPSMSGFVMSLGFSPKKNMSAYSAGFTAESITKLYTTYAQARNLFNAELRKFDSSTKYKDINIKDLKKELRVIASCSAVMDETALIDCLTGVPNMIEDVYDELR